MLLSELQVGDKLDFDPTITLTEYNDMLATWTKCRDAFDGGVVIKNKGEDYLPKLSSKQTQGDYDDYLERACWLDATGVTGKAFRGMVFRKDPIVDGNINIVSADGSTVEDLLREVFDELFKVNRVGVLEDFQKMDGSQLTQLEAESTGIGSHTSLYKAENIINWKVDVIDGVKQPVYFVLTETRDIPGKNPLQPEQETIYRILFVENKTYFQMVISEKKTGKVTDYIVDEIVVPLKNGSPLNRIPFWVLDSDGINIGVNTPVIYGLVELNFAHYRNSADYERELHRIAIKTAIFPGWDKNEPIELGGALATPEGETPFILESKSTSPLNAEMTKKEERMASLGAQMLAQKGRYIQSAQTAQIQSRGESSIVASLARSIENVFSMIFSFKGEWSGTGPVKIELNTDFDETRYDSSDLKPLFELLQGGGLSFDAYFNALNQLEMYPKGWTQENEIAAIANTQEVLTAMPSGDFDLLQQQINEISLKLQKPEGEDDDRESGRPINTSV